MTLHSWLAHQKRSLAPLWSSCVGAMVFLAHRAHRAPMTVFCGSTHSVFAHRKPTKGPQQAKLLFILYRSTQARSKRYQRMSNFHIFKSGLFVWQDLSLLLLGFFTPLRASGSTVKWFTFIYTCSHCWCTVEFCCPWKLFILQLHHFGWNMLNVVFFFIKTGKNLIQTQREH